MNILELNTIKEIGFVPIIIIIGGWLYAVILTLLCIYNAILYMVHRK